MEIEDLVLSIEQSKHLQELGLEMNDAALGWVEYNNMAEQKEENMVAPIYLVLHDQFIPTYTLQEVLDKLPEIIEYDNDEFELDINFGYSSMSYSIRDVDLVIFHFGTNMREAAYNMLCWVIENGYLEEDKK